MKHAALIPALIPALMLTLAGCGGASTTPAENEALAAENKAGLGGDVVELPSGEGEGEGEGVEAEEANMAASVPAVAPSPAAIARADGWVGRWRGVEGLNLVIAKGDAPGRYDLDMQYSLDDKGKFVGTATEEGIAFKRPDGDQVLRAGNGEATGLKWLAEKKDCLVVKPSEGYCRD
ncbi:hypothetical protein [Sphingomonas sp. Y38-1Y]|uniref:hypothetical protein n=1 Tax=Sphingomonas sp. Y38-1Y TaxID=3078265 RepID=UPI0028F1038D|nr:hypothetical protein [Sphingomonas sp. Y38-1Y]